MFRAYEYYTNSHGSGIGRLTSVVGGATTIQLYGQSGQLLSEFVPGTSETNYAYLDGFPVAAIDTTGANIYALHTDRLGTPWKATNSSKSVVWSGAYAPFGTVSPTGSITQNLRFPGQYADPTGFYHNGFRDYVPAYGRYLESDPTGLLGGMNTYGYANQNPLKYIDPLGLDEAPPGYWPLFINPPPIASDVSLVPQIDQQATMDKGESCFATCSNALFSSPGMDAVQSASVAAATPLPKSTFGFLPPSLGSSPNTNLGSVLAYYGRGLPQSPVALFGTRNVCRIASRANEFAAAGEVLYDTSAIASCMADCESK